MKAYAHLSHGGPEVLQVIEFPKPSPNGHDLLVKVIATATNPIDCKVRGGKATYKATQIPKIVGWDASGIVESVGDKVSTFKVGDEVYFAGNIALHGANAEYTLVDERITGKKPKSLTWEQAATVPLCALTAWEPLFENAGLRIPEDGGPNPNASKTILVIGGAGGVGSIAIQFAKKLLKFGKVIATASRPETISWCQRMGADIVIGHNDLKANLENVGFSGVNFVFVTNELNSVFDTAVDVAKPTGTIIGITGFQGVDAGKIFFKRLTLISEFMFSRSIHQEEPEKQGEILNKVAELIDAGVVVHTQNHHFEWHQLPEAHQLQESGKAIGKIGLTVKF